MNSFRLRLALLSALLTGVVLTLFGAGTWGLIRNIKIERIDNEIRAGAERETGRSRSVDEWQRVEVEIVSSLGIRDNRNLTLFVQDSTGETIYRSSHWPASIDTANLPWPELRAAQSTSRLGKNDASLDMLRPPPPPQMVSEDSQRESAPENPGPPPQVSPPVSAAIFRKISGHLWHIGLANADNARIAIAVDTKIIDADMKNIRNAYVLAVPFALILIGIGAWVFSGRATRPLKKLIAAAHRVTDEGLNQQILIQGEDREFVELIDVFNQMLAKLKSKQAELVRMALHDTLTGLPNRRQLIEYIRQALSRAKRNSVRVAALFLDLDGFKQINDALGHESGDEALKEVTRRLKLIIRQTDTLSRLGGDEFVLLVADIDEENEGHIVSLAEKCINSVAQPFCLRGTDCNLTFPDPVRTATCFPVTRFGTFSFSNSSCLV